MDWLELSVEADPEAVEAVSELFARTGYNGGVVVEQAIIAPQEETATWEELAHPEIDPTRPVSVRTYLPNDAQAEEKRLEIERALWALGMMRQVGPLNVRACKEEDWANAWKAYYGIQRVGARTVIKPSWLEYHPKEGDVVLDLDPGMAFGTGLHPTTRLCLRAIEDLTADDGRGEDRDLPVLDLGTGSGILAIAAAKQLGTGSRIVALDIDPIAVDATRENVARNSLSAQIEVRQGSAREAERDGPYRLILANILASVIIELARSLRDLLAPGGRLIASGIFVDKGDAAAAALEKVGLSVLERLREGDWLCLVCAREP